MVFIDWWSLSIGGLYSDVVYIAFIDGGFQICLCIQVVFIHIWSLTQAGLYNELRQQLCSQLSRQ